MVSALEFEIVFCGSYTTFVHTIELSIVDAGSTPTLWVLDIDVELISFALLESEIASFCVWETVSVTNAELSRVDEGSSEILVVTLTKVRCVESIDMELPGEDDNDDDDDSDGNGDADGDQALHWVQLVGLWFSGN